MRRVMHWNCYINIKDLKTLCEIVPKIFFKKSACFASSVIKSKKIHRFTHNKHLGNQDEFMINIGYSCSNFPFPSFGFLRMLLSRMIYQSRKLNIFFTKHFHYPLQSRIQLTASVHRRAVAFRNLIIYIWKKYKCICLTLC